MNEHWFWIVYNQGNCKLQEIFENLYDCPWIYSYEFYTLPTWNKSLACATLSFDLKVAAAAKSLQSCLTLCDPMDCSLPGFSIHGILQARTLAAAAAAAAAAAKSLQSCPTLCDPRDGSPPGSPVPGILQARTLEWVAISFSNAWKWKVKAKSLSCVPPSATPWTAAYQAPSSMGFSRQEYWSGVPLPSLDLKVTTL